MTARAMDGLRPWLEQLKASRICIPQRVVKAGELLPILKQRSVKESAVLAHCRQAWASLTLSVTTCSWCLPIMQLVLHGPEAVSGASMQSSPRAMQASLPLPRCISKPALSRR